MNTGQPPKRSFALSQCREEEPLLASLVLLLPTDEFVLTRQSWSYPLTSHCVSLSCSTLQIHLQRLLQLPKGVFLLKQPCGQVCHCPFPP